MEGVDNSYVWDNKIPRACLDFHNVIAGIEREITSLQLEEKRLVAESKKTAKTGNEAATKILARQLVRLRQQITNLQGSRAQIRGVTTHTQFWSSLRNTKNA